MRSDREKEMSRRSRQHADKFFQQWLIRSFEEEKELLRDTKNKYEQVATASNKKVLDYWMKVPARLMEKLRIMCSICY